jgi:hypothetical protein
MVGRPYLPDYGTGGAQHNQRLLPWSWATERLQRATNYWITTSQPDGQPHLTPVWGIWLDETFFFSTGQQSRKARNLALNPRCVVCPERADQPMIVEGIAKVVTDPALLQRVAETYSEKYQWPVEPTPTGVQDQHGNQGPVFAVHPRVAFGWEEFPQSATRWTFEG